MSASGPLTASAKSTFATNGSFHKETARHSPPPLAPLLYLQTHRRGSITDPSLHAAPMNSSITLNTSYRQPFDQPGSASSGPSSARHDSSPKNHASDPRPVSPYVFGDATPHLSDNSLQIRNLLRSPSVDRSSSALSHEGTQASADVISNTSVPTKANETVFGRHSSREQPQFDYSMRRHSIAVGQDPHARPPISHGTKRKMSADRPIFATVGEEIDPQLAGPGIPSVMDVDMDARAPKRRGSAVDTHRISQLSLDDRRHSVDSRGAPQWWINERRDSTSSMLSNVSSMASYSSGFTGGESPHGRTSSSPWVHPPDPSISTATPAEAEQNPSSGVSRFGSTSPLNMVPSMNLAPDRRMSVPDTLISTPRRVLRSRSRPPSRQRSNADSNTHSGPSSGQDESPSVPSSANITKQAKETGNAPYARTPELRVSHKLAERKRRKEMKDLFDELRDQLPADRGMKASKWEILSKAIDFVAQLKQSHQDMAREVEGLRHELEATRHGGVPFPSGGPLPHANMGYGHGLPMPVAGHFPPAPPPQGIVQHQQPQMHSPATISRPGSSQNGGTPTIGSSTGPLSSSRNGNVEPSS